MVCSAAWSIGLSADEPVVEPGREHAAIRRATPTSELAAALMGNSNVIFPMITVAETQKKKKTHSYDLTTKAQRPPPRGATTQTATARRRSQQRMVGSNLKR